MVFTQRIVCMVGLLNESKIVTHIVISLVKKTFKILSCIPEVSQSELDLPEFKSAFF